MKASARVLLMIAKTRGSKSMEVGGVKLAKRGVAEAGSYIKGKLIYQ